MKTFKELKQAIEDKRILIWNDPDYIEGNDYKISFIREEDILEEVEPILIGYGFSSEAEVFLHEILVHE